MKKYLVILTVFITFALSLSSQNVQDSTKTKKEKIFTPELRFILPIPSTIPGTVASNIESPSNYKKVYGNFKTWGFGVAVNGRINKNLRIIADMSGYNYMQEIAQKGEDANVSIGIGQILNFPEGLKYKTYTTSIRLSAKYAYAKFPHIQPWIGYAWGINIWTCEYVNWAEDAFWGKAKGTTFRGTLLAGVDLKADGFGTFTIFFETHSPVAKYTMTNLFGVGDYSTFDALTYPNPRIGFGISF